MKIKRDKNLVILIAIVLIGSIGLSYIGSLSIIGDGVIEVTFRPAGVTYLLQPEITIGVRVIDRAEDIAITGVSFNIKRDSTGDIIEYVTVSDYSDWGVNYYDVYHFPARGVYTFTITIRWYDEKIHAGTTDRARESLTFKLDIQDPEDPLGETTTVTNGATSETSKIIDGYPDMPSFDIGVLVLCIIPLIYYRKKRGKQNEIKNKN